MKQKHGSWHEITNDTKTLRFIGFFLRQKGFGGPWRCYHFGYRFYEVRVYYSLHVYFLSRDMKCSDSLTRRPWEGICKKKKKGCGKIKWNHFLLTQHVTLVSGSSFFLALLFGVSTLIYFCLFIEFVCVCFSRQGAMAPTSTRRSWPLQ